jgi:hypothetical protein
MRNMALAVCFAVTVVGCGPEGSGPVGDDGLSKLSQGIAGGSPDGRIRALGGRCLDVIGNGTANRTGIQIFSCNGGANQRWSIPMGVAGPFASQATGKVMDAPYDGDYSTTWLFSWWGGPNQYWSMPSVEVHGVGGNCMDVPYTSDGSIVWMYQCWGGANQRWFYDRTTGELKTSDGRCLEYIEARVHAPVLAGTCTGGANQRWGTGLHGVFSSGGYCLDVTGGGTANRTPLQLYTCLFNDAQRFSIKGPIVGMSSGKCLQLHSTSSGVENFDHSVPELFTCNGTAQQDWEFQW